MGSQRNTGAFIAGSVIGGIVGAAVALWKTPQSGPELRASLSGGERHGAVTYRTETEVDETAGRRFSNPVLGFVEKATAPIVGVELGKLAKDHPESYAAPVRTSSADARPPETIGETVTVASDSIEVTQPLGTVERASTDAFHAESPDEEVTHDSVEGSSAHAATTEELTTPTEEYVEELQHEHETEHIHTTGDFHFGDQPKGDGTR
jgi:gas vesicle protein